MNTTPSETSFQVWINDEIGTSQNCGSLESALPELKVENEQMEEADHSQARLGGGGETLRPSILISSSPFIENASCKLMPQFTS